MRRSGSLSPPCGRAAPGRTSFWAFRGALIIVGNGQVVQLSGVLMIDATRCVFDEGRVDLGHPAL